MASFFDRAIEMRDQLPEDVRTRFDMSACSFLAGMMLNVWVDGVSHPVLEPLFGECSQYLICFSMVALAHGVIYPLVKNALTAHR